MKIGILTQPLHNNYGGILQAYALQKILVDNGHDVIIINRGSSWLKGIKRYFSVIKRLTIKVLFDNRTIVRIWPTIEELKVINKHTNEFIEKNIKSTKYISNNYKLKKVIEDYKFEAYIVGSDQVWRVGLSPNIYNYFLDFVFSKSCIKRISYAASFGIDRWEYSKFQTLKCRKLIRKFDFVSVREDSGVLLCDKYFGVSVEHVVDPTMLLNVQNYIDISKGNIVHKNKGDLFIYILDSSAKKVDLVNKVSLRNNLIPFTVSPNKKFEQVGSKGICECEYPTVSAWITGFIDAEFVITDSFHGTVFSIIFNKQFLTISNASRGNSRIISLLKLFNLESRLILESEISNIDLLDDVIDFSEVNKTLEILRNKSLEYLMRSIS